MQRTNRNKQILAFQNVSSRSFKSQIWRSRRGKKKARIISANGGCGMAVLRGWWRNTQNKSRVMVARYTWKREPSSRVTKIKFLRSIAPRMFPANTKMIANSGHALPCENFVFRRRLKRDPRIMSARTTKPVVITNDEWSQETTGRRIPRINGEKLFEGWDKNRIAWRVSYVRSLILRATMSVCTSSNNSCFSWFTEHQRQWRWISFA